jgi:hypothetical protein
MEEVDVAHYAQTPRIITQMLLFGAVTGITVATAGRLLRSRIESDAQARVHLWCKAYAAGVRDQAAVKSGSAVSPVIHLRQRRSNASLTYTSPITLTRS